MKKELLVSIVLGLGILGYCGACTKINEQFGLQNDSLPEELVEWVIEQTTQLDVDLAPDSPEE